MCWYNCISYLVFPGLCRTQCLDRPTVQFLWIFSFQSIFFQTCILYHYSFQIIWCKTHRSNAPVSVHATLTVRNSHWLRNSPCKNWALPTASEGGQTGWITLWYLIYHPSLSPGLYLLSRELWCCIFRWAFVVLKLKSDCSWVLISVKKKITWKTWHMLVSKKHAGPWESQLNYLPVGFQIYFVFYG